MVCGPWWGCVVGKGRVRQSQVHVIDYAHAGVRANTLITLCNQHNKWAD
jgi:hypothetical protein